MRCGCGCGGLGILSSVCACSTRFCARSTWFCARSTCLCARSTCFCARSTRFCARAPCSARVRLVFAHVRHVFAHVRHVFAHVRHVFAHARHVLRVFDSFLRTRHVLRVFDSFLRTCVMFVRTFDTFLRTCAMFVRTFDTFLRTRAMFCACSTRFCATIRRTLAERVELGYGQENRIGGPSMIRKQRSVPIRIRALEAAKRRLPLNHPKMPQITKELAISWAGYRGEQSLDYHLSFLPEDKYHILHDLRLADHKNRHFQLDTLLLCPQYALILEVKNILGSLYFDQEFHQLVRTKDGLEEAFKDPITQVNRLQDQLTTWLTHHHYPQISIHSFVVLANASSLIKTNHKNIIQRKVVRAENLPTKINQLYSPEVFTPTTLEVLATELVQKHTPPQYNVLNLFQIPVTDIRTGVHCPSCFTLPMNREHGYWLCPHCYTRSKEAHLPSMQDYAFLYGTSITIQQAQHFLNIPSRHLARRILVLLGLHRLGNAYILPLVP